MNRFVIILFSVLILISYRTFSQNEEILITIGDTEITKAEFERIYKKNNNNLYDESDRKSPKEYLDLFINYKLKVIEAQHLKMDTSQSFKQELEGYRKDLAAPYLTDQKLNEKLVYDTYERMTKEVNASHILLRLSPNASRSEEETVLQKLDKIKNEIIAGKDFGEAAVEYSEDPSAKTNKGDLGYFTAFQMVAPFEEAAFNLSPGELSGPVRTSFGYHLLQVHDIRENKGDIKVAHIMKMFPQNVTEKQKAKLKTEIDSIYNLLKNGADFEEMAKKLSDDKRSGANGGVMAWFNAGQMIKSFSDAAFDLKNIGDYTVPIETQYGYHIIKKLDYKPVPPFEDAKLEIESNIKKDPTRNTSGKKAFVEKLKKEYEFTEQKEILKTVDNDTIIAEEQAKNMVLFSLNGKDFAVSDYNEYLANENLEEKSYNKNYEKWVDAEIMDYESNRLEEKYSDFKYLVKEYHDGILLFNIMQKKIWNFAAEDSTGLEAFYNKVKDKYMWEERFKGSIIKTKNEKVRNEAEKYFSEGLTVEEIEYLLNNEEEQIRIKPGTWEQGNDSVVDYYIWNGPKPESLDETLTYVRGDMIEPEPKSLEEARGLYISDYQNYLEEKWLKELRKKYKIKVNKKLLKSIPDA